jgi:cytochrome c553
MEFSKLRSEFKSPLRGNTGFSSRRSRTVQIAAATAILASALAGCRLDMHVQPKYVTEQPTDFFHDGRSERPVVPGTVARGQLRVDELLYTGKENGVPSNRFPFPITRADLERGRERFNIYCTPCHDYTGNGDGMIVQRGLSHPPSYHIDRLRNVPVGHFVDVMTNGFGAMYSYASRVSPADRWRIAAYIRALQLSQYAPVEDVPPDERQKLGIVGSASAAPVVPDANGPATARASGETAGTGRKTQ